MSNSTLSECGCENTEKLVCIFPSLFVDVEKSHLNTIDCEEYHVTLSTGQLCSHWVTR